MSSTNRWPHLVNAIEIEAWAERLDSRGQFPGIVRMLINRNNDQITRLDMRDSEGTGAHGYDGVVDALKASTLVPDGHSVWEMGVGGDARAKANKDYRDRTKDPQGEEPANTTFIFVTPQRWDDKDEWASGKMRTGPWKAVRVLDVSNLIQGLEEAPAVHVRFSELAGKAGSGVRSIEDWWQRFCAKSSPAVSSAIALAGRSDQAARLLALLEETRNLTTIRAASIDDVLAFVAATMLTTPAEERSDLLSRTLIVHDATVLRQLDSSEALLILLPFEEQMRREAELVGSNHALLMCEEEVPADIELDPIDTNEVTQLLVGEGVPGDLARELGQAAAGSLRKFQRVARQRMSQRPTPEPTWNAAFSDRNVRRAWLLRSWTTARSGDTDVFERLIGKTFEDMEEALRDVARGADPIFSTVGPVWSVVSPADFWEHARPHLAMSDLQALERTIQDVLGAVDPALELRPDERWLAGMRGMTRIHSRELRRGLATTLALVGALGEMTVRGSGVTGSAWVRGMLYSLFARANADNTGQLWASLTDVLPLLAEASPDAFLGALDEALTPRNGAMSQMFGDNGGGSFTSSSPHTGLLWALEVTAWLPAHFGQSVNALAALCTIDPGGRLTNRPFNSLKDIFRLWLPQTLVNQSDRLASLAALAERYPNVGPRLLTELLPSGHDTAMSNAKPKFRPVTEPRPADMRELVETTAAIMSLLLPMARARADLWPALLGHLDSLPPDERDRAYAELPISIEALSTEARTGLWEKATDLIRRHREYHEAGWALPEEELIRFEAAIADARPADPRDEARWLFDETHPNVGIRKASDLVAYDKEIAKKRADAIRRVLDEYGLAGVEEFARTIKYSYLVGAALAEVDQ